MPVLSDQNLYPGINAHLNSFLQNEPGGWESFHLEYVVGIARILDETLPPDYFTLASKGMQISELASSSDILSPDDYLTSAVIHQQENGNLLGRPVTRIELLSPANKPGGSHYGQYSIKRLETLQSGLRLVEIDYLHQTPPVIKGVASYPEGEEGARPYIILVSDPRPTWDKGETAVYDFGVDDPLPIISIPLAGVDRVILDFGAVYNRTFSSSRFFRQIVDYAQDPSHFERYHEIDRERIRQRLAAIVRIS